MKSPKKPFNLEVEFKRAKDGRWIAETPSMPGVTGRARTRKDALAELEERALKVIVEKMARGESKSGA